MKVKDIIKKLEKHVDQDTEILIDIWHTNDIIETAKDMEIDLTSKQVKEVMEQLENTHNAEIGINWDTIENAINEVFEGYPNT